ncbi:MAG: type II secretion system minor pseudopilin GspJ [Gammaproteobacteria bacterium]|nr:type II secretion system minor pseudopilin GspJ [Gammaproteobacteria bacterium]
MISRRPAQNGFTLLELLVALGIFALLAAMSYSGLNSVMLARQVTNQHAERLTQLQMVFLWLGRDVEQAIDRSIRDEYGDLQAAMLGVETGRYQLELTRTGWRNPAGRARSDLQRVAYGLRDGELVRVYWNVLDRAQDSQPLESVLLDGVDKLELRFLDSANNWQTSWPAGQTGGQAIPGSARAVEVTLETTAEGRITRLFRVPG